MKNPLEGHPYRGAPSPEERARLLITENEMHDAERAKEEKKRLRHQRKSAEKREREQFIENEIAYLKLELASLRFGAEVKRVGFHRFDVKKWAEAFIAERYGRNKISNEELVKILGAVDSTGYAEREVLEALDDNEKYKLAECHILNPQLETYQKSLERQKEFYKYSKDKDDLLKAFERRYKPSIPKPTPDK